MDNSLNSEVKVSQVLIEDYDSSDLLIANALKQKNTGNKIDLTFSHAMTKIECNVIFTAEVTEPIEVMIDNTVVDYKVKLSDKSITLGANVASVAVHPEGAKLASEYPSRAIIVPQTIRGGTKFISVVVGEQKYVYTQLTDFEFESGYKYAVTINIDNITQSVSASSIMRVQ